MNTRHALLTAIYALLISDGELDGMLAGGKVYDHAPRAAAFPFVAFGDLTSRSIDGDDVETEEHALEVAVYSRAGGRLEASAIAERVRALIAAENFPIDGHRLVSARHRDTVVSESRDHRAYRARLRFRVLTEAN